MTTHIIKMKSAAQSVLITALAAMLAISCSEEPVGQTPTDKNPPPALTDVKAEATPGGAKITYTLPKETDISYVKGEFTFQGKPKVVRASVHDSYLTVEGLSSVEPVTMTLWLVDHSENLSPPVTVKFTPDAPPVATIFTSLKAKPDFGGTAVTWENPTGVEVGVIFYTFSAANNRYDEITVEFSRAKAGKSIFRGLEAVENKFAIQIIDKWGNLSDLYEFVLTPLFEELLDRTKMSQYRLPYDNTSDNGGGQVFSKILDGDKTSPWNESWHTNENQNPDRMGYTTPVLFTIDLGRETILSRFTLWQGRYMQDFLYSHHNPRYFEVWGTAEPATGKPNDYWHEEWKQDWTLLGDFEIIKPSGLPMGQLNDEDILQANAGHGCDVAVRQSVRYVRFSVKGTWVGDKDNAITIHELEFWGAE